MNLLTLTSGIISSGGKEKPRRTDVQVAIKDTKLQYKVTLRPTIRQEEFFRRFKGFL